MKTPKKVREWYSTYRQSCKKAGREPQPIRIWAAIDAESRTGARLKELNRFLERNLRDD